MLYIQHFYFCANQVNMAWYDVKPLDVGRVHGISDVGLVDDALIERALHIFDVHAKTTGGIRLWVGIDHQDSLLQCC